jgi:hypothetical protein
MTGRYAAMLSAACADGRVAFHAQSRHLHRPGVWYPPDVSESVSMGVQLVKLLVGPARRGQPCRCRLHPDAKVTVI